MIDDGFEIFRCAAYREIRELALSVAERGPTHEAIRQALADVLDDLDTDPAAFWKRNDCLTSEKVFAERRARADLAEFDRLMNRRGGAPPREGDEVNGRKIVARPDPDEVLARASERDGVLS